MRSKRARRRNKGKRIEAAKAEKKVAMKMWRKLSDTEHKHGWSGVDNDIGLFYCPYIPIMRNPMGVIITNTAA